MRRLFRDLSTIRANPLFTLILGMIGGVVVLMVEGVILAVLVLMGAHSRSELRRSADCLYIMGRYNEVPAHCHDVAYRVEQLREGHNPFADAPVTAGP